MSTLQVTKLHTYSGHKDAIYTIEPMDGQAVFFSGAGDGMIVRWDLDSPDQGHLVAKLQNSVYALHSIANLNQLVVGHNYQGIHIIDLDSNREKGSLALSSAAIFDIKYLGGKLLVASGSGEVHVVTHETLKVESVLQHSDKSARCIGIAPDQQEFSVGYSDNVIRVFDATTYTLKYELTGHSNSVFTVAYHPSQSVLLSAGRDAHLRVWNLDDYSANQSIAAHMYAINHVEFSPNGHHFVTCSMDKSIKVWDAHQFKLLKVIDKARHAGHGTSVNKLYWSHYNQQLVSCSDDRTISVWDLKF